MVWDPHAVWWPGVHGVCVCSGGRSLYFNKSSSASCLALNRTFLLRSLVPSVEDRPFKASCVLIPFTPGYIITLGSFSPEPKRIPKFRTEISQIYALHNYNTSSSNPFSVPPPSHYNTPPALSDTIPCSCFPHYLLACHPALPPLFVDALLPCVLSSLTSLVLTLRGKVHVLFRDKI